VNDSAVAGDFGGERGGLLREETRRRRRIWEGREMKKWETENIEFEILENQPWSMEKQGLWDAIPAPAP